MKIAIRPSLAVAGLILIRFPHFLAEADLLTELTLYSARRFCRRKVKEFSGKMGRRIAIFIEKIWLKSQFS